MKKFAAVLLSLLLVMGSFAAFAEDVDLSGYTDDELRLLMERIDVELSARSSAAMLEGGVIAEGDLGDYHVAILEVKRIEDYKGNPALLIRFMFANNGDDDKSFSLAFSSKVFQNGVQCESAMVLNSDKIGHDPMSLLMDVKPGATLECTKVVGLYDTTSPVEIQVQELFDMSKNPAQVAVTLAVPAE